MLSLLVRIFIKHPDAFKDNTVREQYGILTGALGIGLNIFLFLLKLFAGLITKSVAVTADAVNNLSDAGSSLLTIIGFKLSSKKPDREHPFGHGRFEYITGLVVSIFILLMGIELFKSSVKSIIHPQPVTKNLLTIFILIISIGIKIYMYFYNHSTAKKIASAAMDATAKDSLSDTISTFVVLASFAASYFTDFKFDGIAGLFVALFIIYSGYTAAKETIEPLLGSAPKKEFVNDIEKEVLQHKPIAGIHDLVVHDYGPGRRFISLHAEVPGDGNIFDLHDIIDNVEYTLSKKFGCEAVIHMDPIDLNNKELGNLKHLVLAEIKHINSDFTIHDFRMVPGRTHTNLIFDVVKPSTCTAPDETIKKEIIDRVHTICPVYHCVVNIDQAYV
ncbi:MAG: cation diffusion facilitator family transporter [Treponema sp.]|jgi:cation diffusion facilitator family transporter|nr:cation diffusion facilitator family transporter [Treponema sp.]